MGSAPRTRAGCDEQPPNLQLLIAAVAAIALSKFDPAIQIVLASALGLTLSGMAKIVGTPHPRFEARLAPVTADLNVGTRTRTLILTARVGWVRRLGRRENQAHSSPPPSRPEESAPRFGATPIQAEWQALPARTIRLCGRPTVAPELYASKLTVASPDAAPAEPGVTGPRRKSERPESLDHLDVAVERDLARIMARALVQQFVADAALSTDTSTDGADAPT